MLYSAVYAETSRSRQSSFLPPANMGRNANNLVPSFVTGRPFLSLHLTLLFFITSALFAQACVRNRRKPIRIRRFHTLGVSHGGKYGKNERSFYPSIR